MGVAKTILVICIEYARRRGRRLCIMGTFYTRTKEHMGGFVSKKEHNLILNTTRQLNEGVRINNTRLLI